MNKWRETHYQFLRLRVVIERIMNVKLLRALNRWVIIFVEEFQQKEVQQQQQQQQL